MPRDSAAIDTIATVQQDDLRYYCVRCGELVTLEHWAISQNGDHEHVVFNPAGLVFRILCFRDAPGTRTQGEASAVFSWFKGYLWRIATCRRCGAHLGWRFEGDAQPRIFFGLIKDALTTAKP